MSDLEKARKSLEKARFWRIYHGPKGSQILETWEEARLQAPTKDDAERIVREAFKDEIKITSEITEIKEVKELKEKMLQKLKEVS